MSPAFDEVRGARVPASALEMLADLRRSDELAVLVRDDDAWLRWETPHESLVLRLMALVNVQLYERRNGAWYPYGRRLPAFGNPLDDAGFATIDRAVIPRPVEAREPAQTPLEPVHLRIVRHAELQPATALRCRLRSLGRWSESVSSQRLASLSGAICGNTVLVLGRNLPEVAPSRRYWGNRMLIPLGFRAEPALPEAAVRMALGIQGDDLLLLERDGYDVVPHAAIVPSLTRASLCVARRRTSR